MKFFGWMQNKLHGKQRNSHRPSISSVSSHQPREEFSDWPHGLLAIGTFGRVTKELETQQEVVEEVIQEEKFSNVHVESQAQDRVKHLSYSDDLEEDFTPEEVGKLQKELTKLLTMRRSKKRKSDVTKELTNLPLDRFLNCPSCLEVDRRISNALSGCGESDEKEENIERTISVILGRCKAISTQSKNKKSRRDLSKTSVSYLLKKMFVCTEGFSLGPNPSLRDTFQESRMEKLLRMMLHKKINSQASSKQTSMKKYLQDKPQLLLKNEEEEARSSSDGSKWVKTDSDFIVLEI